MQNLGTLTILNLFKILTVTFALLVTIELLLVVISVPIGSTHRSVNHGDGTTSHASHVSSGIRSLSIVDQSQSGKSDEEGKDGELHVELVGW